MIFSSIIFLFVFLPILMFLYSRFDNVQVKNVILLLASLLFYAFGEPKYIFVMILVILITYFGGLFIDNAKKYKKPIMILTIFLILSFLVYFKYFNFIVDNINNILHLSINWYKIALPIGISFYTFQAISYIIDVYRGEIKPQNDLYKLALYICLFPQLIAGPIIKYHDIEDQIDNRKSDFDKFNIGVKRFIIGLAKKMLVANTLGLVADKIFSQAPDTFSHGIAWLGAVAYSLQLFFDFSGYSDMAIGLGLIFGFKFMENFNYPYISRSISEFWRRWHISLSTWFKHYVYIPLGGNKVSKIITTRNLAFVFLLTGIWHGASWIFVVWGIWNGLFIIFEKLINLKGLQEKYNNIFSRFVQHIYCILAFVIGWVIFRSESLSYALKYIGNMFGFINTLPENITYTLGYYIDLYEIIIFAIAILCCTPIFKNILEYKNTFVKIAVNTFLLAIFILSVSAIAANTYNPFIYFRF